jgi:murein DD-endopeptidase MepM/ murein hydrolase activator NlpD
MQVNIQVAAKAYRREFINVLADRTNLLDPAVDDAEMNILRGVMSAFNPERYFTSLMGLPAAAGISSPFGSLRTYNGSDIQRIHTGTDFAGAPGSPIFAPASGRVVLADTLNIRGVATVIDHGWGIYTGYWHQSDRYVSLGDFVTTGQVIGAIGSTGRVTGAHLHWELWVNGVPVDPMQWVSVAFVE